MRMLTQGIHFGGSWPNNVMQHGNTLPPDGADTWAGAFHTFGIDWSAQAIQFTIDGQAKFLFRSRELDPGGWFTTSKGAAKCAPFCGQPFFAIINLAVGGKFPEAAPDAATPFPAELQVDYIRVYGK